MDNFDFPSNSNKSKKESEKIAEKKVTKVIKGTAKIQKKGGVRKLADVFLPEDIHTVKEHVIKDLLIPKMQNFAVEAFTAFVKGETFSKKGNSNTPYVSYNNYSNKPDTGTEKRTSGFDYEDIVFTSRGEAEEVLTVLNEIIDQYQILSVMDLYDAAGVTSNNYMLNKYGWSGNIKYASIVHTREGYLLKMPRPRPLK